VEQQNADCLPSYGWHQFAFHRFFSHQPDRPTGAPRWRIAAHHSDDSAASGWAPELRPHWAAVSLERTIQASLLEAVAQPAGYLRGQRNHLSNPGSAGKLS
jgi:hypothetical protein